MKSAQEIVREMLKVDGHYTAEGIIHAINEARIEAIRECAEKAASFFHPHKSAILDLINQVK